jgi:hypothetical protein
LGERICETEFFISRRESQAIAGTIAKICNVEMENSGRKAAVHNLFRGSLRTNNGKKVSRLKQAKGKELTTEHTKVTDKSTQNPLCSLCPRQLLGLRSRHDPTDSIHGIVLRCPASCLRAVVCGEKIRIVFFSCDLLVMALNTGYSGYASLLCKGNLK